MAAILSDPLGISRVKGMSLYSVSKNRFFAPLDRAQKENCKMYVSILVHAMCQQLVPQLTFVTFHATPNEASAKPSLSSSVSLLILLHEPWSWAGSTVFHGV